MCPGAGWARPCPHGSCLPGPVVSQTDGACESRGPSRRGRQLLKGLIVAEGPSADSCPPSQAQTEPSFFASALPLPCPGVSRTEALVCGRLEGAALDPPMA